MVFKKLRKRMKKTKAKKLGMTIEEYEKVKAELKRVEGRERVKFAKWKIKQKYKQKRKQAKSRKKSTGLTAMLESLAGGPSSDTDPFGLFETPKKRRKKRKKSRK